MKFHFIILLIVIFLNVGLMFFSLDKYFRSVTIGVHDIPILIFFLFSMLILLIAFAFAFSRAKKLGKPFY